MLQRKKPDFSNKAMTSEKNSNLKKQCVDHIWILILANEL